MFVPLTTVTLAELSPKELPQGTGLYNFFRQLGGSFGIAVMATLLTRYAAQMRAVIGDHVASTDPGSLARVEMMKHAMMARGADAWTAQQRALSLLSRQLDAQASVISYSKIYMLSALLILALIPLLALVRTGKSSSGAHVIAE
jgi:DHA2 family multidrug resistance protein